MANACTAYGKLEAEKAAIRYGELLATDHLAIDDGVYDDLRRHFSEEQIVELGTYAAFCVGFGRLGATWNMIEELPDRFKTNERATPWGGDSDHPSMIVPQTTR